MINYQPLIHLRRELHQIPELGFEEVKTQKKLQQYLAGLPAKRMQVKTWQTGLLVKIPGTQPRKCIAFRSDIDGLPISEQTDYPFASTHPGQMHACGHDVHMSIAMGILTHFVHHPIANDLLFLFQPAEEGPGGAFPMMQSQEFQEWKPDYIFALHIAPNYPVGTIALKPGILFANSTPVEIQLQGTSGHAALPHLCNDMVIAATEMVSQLQTVVSRNIDPLDAAVISIGRLTAGTKENIIAAEATLHGSLRALRNETMQLIQQRILDIAKGIEASFQCTVNVDFSFGYIQVENEPELTAQFMDWTQKNTPYKVIQCPATLAGEDFGFFLREIPGLMFWLGVDTPYGLHHPKIQPSEEAIPVAIQLMTQYITQF